MITIIVAVLATATAAGVLVAGAASVSRAAPRLPALTEKGDDLDVRARRSGL